MKFRTKVIDEQTQVELTPMIDVVFLLLIFFMVSTTFKAESKILVELPKTTSHVETAVEPLIVLSVDANGIIEYRGNILSLPKLGEVLLALSEGDKDKPILVRADQQVAHGIVVGVIDQAKQHGFKRISIATRIGPERRN